jgi:cardiolipin synthase
MDAVVAEFHEASTLLDFDAWNRRPLWHKYADNVARLTSALL